MTKKKVKTDIEIREELVQRLLKEANELYGLEADTFHWKIRKGSDGNTDICDWTFEKGEHKLIGSFIFSPRYGDCALALGTGIGLSVHPFRNQLLALLNYTTTVAQNEVKRNSLGELVVRGYIWHNMIGKIPRDDVMMQLLKDFRIKDNIDELYRVFLNKKLVDSKGKYI